MFKKRLERLESEIRAWAKTAFMLRHNYKACDTCGAVHVREKVDSRFLWDFASPFTCPACVPKNREKREMELFIQTHKDEIMKLKERCEKEEAKKAEGKG